MGDPPNIKDWFTDPLPHKERTEIIKEVKADIGPVPDNSVECSLCSSSGFCDFCDGEGEVEHNCDCEVCTEVYQECEDCYGNGKCQDCDGSGFIEE